MPQIMQPDRRQPTPAHRRNTARSGCWTLSRCPWEPPCRPASRRRPWSAVLVWKASWTHAAQGSRSPFSSGLARRAPGRSRLGDGHRRRGRGTAVVLSPAPPMKPPSPSATTAVKITVGQPNRLSFLRGTIGSSCICGAIGVPQLEGAIRSRPAPMTCSSARR
jgi:hypothetical protein